jgi:hypothetical protein
MALFCRANRAEQCPQSLQFARPMMRRGAGFDTNEARRQLLKVLDRDCRVSLAQR